MKKSGINSVEVGKIAGEIVDKTLPEIDVDLVITQKEYRQRWQKIQAKLKEKGYHHSGCYCRVEYPICFS